MYERNFPINIFCFSDTILRVLKGNRNVRREINSELSDVLLKNNYEKNLKLEKRIESWRTTCRKSSTKQNNGINNLVNVSMTSSLHEVEGKSSRAIYKRPFESKNPDNTNLSP